MKFLAFILTVFLSGVSCLQAEVHQHPPLNGGEEPKTIRAAGVIKSIAEDHMSMRIFHDPISELKWPAMNMPFDVADRELTYPLKSGDKVHFEFIQKEGKNVITKISQ